MTNDSMTGNGNPPHAFEFEPPTGNPVLGFLAGPGPVADQVLAAMGSEAPGALDQLLIEAHREIDRDAERFQADLASGTLRGEEPATLLFRLVELQTKRVNVAYMQNAATAKHVTSVMRGLSDLQARMIDSLVELREDVDDIREQLDTGVGDEPTGGHGD